METLVLQRLNYAKIELFKNYCLLKDKHSPKPKTIWYSINQDSLIYENFEPVTSFDPLNPHISHHYIPEIRNKKCLYFDEIYPLKSAGIVYTTDENKIKKYYGEVFAGVEITLHERSLRLKGDVLILKNYTLTKIRHPQTKYFKKSSSSLILSINLKTGNFKIIRREGKNKYFRANQITTLKNTLETLMNRDKGKCPPSKLSGIFKETFDDSEFNRALSNLLGFKFLKSNVTQTYENFLCWFANKKQIKTPDDFIIWLEVFYPTEKYLKRNDRKLMVSILDMYGIKSKITNRLVHQYPNMNIKGLAELCYLFGSDFSKYLPQLDIEWFNPVREAFALSIDSSNQYKNLINVGQDFTLVQNVRTIDKERVIKFLNALIKNKGGQQQGIRILDYIYLIMDHLKMLKTIREYDSEKQFSATTMDEFREEHDEFAKLVSKIKKGWTIEYQFNQDMVSDVEKPVTIEINIGDETNPKIESITFYPHVLKREEEYIEEGEFMHHCVATYADKDKSVIISLRTEDAKDRITCEFDGQSGLCLQARHFCNKPIPGDFDLALDKIKAKTAYYSRRGMLHHTHKTRVPLVINNIEVKPPEIVATLNEQLFPY